MTLLAAAPQFPPTNVENWISGFGVGVIAVLLGCLVGMFGLFYGIFTAGTDPAQIKLS
jgi:hypothetical protein